ncbi:MAG TPA: hypothetical protein PKL15_04130 [Saprospiraceae bacterium]|nr:hypothetical protein [Saprospiraceae bacterium]
MSKTSLMLFWIFWLLDVLLALYGYREFILGTFGQYAAPTPKYLRLWILLLTAALLLLSGSIYLKDHGRPGLALTLVAIPMILALPYLLYIVSILLLGPKNWR